MNKRNIVFAFVILILHCSCKENQNGAIVKYNKKVIDLGNIDFRKEFDGKIMIYNIGDKPLKLIDATADCSCTVPENVKNSLIQPNDSFSLKFKLTPALDGYIQQTIFLNNDSKNEKRILFLIRANVKLI